MIGGEALSISHVRRALERLPATQIINGYGPRRLRHLPPPIPSRARCQRRCKPSPWSARPIANTTVYVLDAMRSRVRLG